MDSWDLELSAVNAGGIALFCSLKITDKSINGPPIYCIRNTSTQAAYRNRRGQVLIHSIQGSGLASGHINLTMRSDFLGLG